MTKEAGQQASSQGRSPRILFFGEAIALSHVARPFLLATHLQQKGYEVCFARDPRYSQLFFENDLNVVDIKSVASNVAAARLARHEPVHDVETLTQYIQDDLRIIRQFKPEIIVGDFRHSLAISSQLARIPYVNIADGHWCPAVDTQYELPNSPLSGLIGMPLSNLLFNAFQPLAFAYQTLPLNLVRMQYGLSAINPDVKACNTYGDYTIYPNDSALFSFKSSLPTRHTFVGPLLWSPVVEKPEWWDRVPLDRPVIYVSLGSTGEPGLLDSVIKVLEHLPVSVMLATAGRWKPRQAAPSIFVADFLPGAEAAGRSNLVICNGGTMSGQQALSAGTPYLGLISNLDQMLFSMAVRESQACELLREGDVNESALHSIILKMLAHEGYGIAARKIATRADGLNACQKFESIISSILEGYSSDSLVLNAINQ